MLPDKFLPSAVGQRKGNRHNKRVRHFLAALRRYRPLLVISLDSINDGTDDSGTPFHVLVVTDEALDWATVDRLSDGVIQPAVYQQGEFLAALSDPRNPLGEAVKKGTVLYRREEAEAQLRPVWTYLS